MGEVGRRPYGPDSLEGSRSLRTEPDVPDCLLILCDFSKSWWAQDEAAQGSAGLSHPDAPNCLLPLCRFVTVQGRSICTNPEEARVKKTIKAIKHLRKITKSQDPSTQKP